MAASIPEARSTTGPRIRSVLNAVRVSRCVRDRFDAGDRAVVRAVQRRGCHLAVEGGALLILSALEVPLAPNALAVDVGSHGTLEDRGLRVGQVVALGVSAARHDARDRDADWLVALGTASTWEPRPRVHRVVAHDLIDRVRTTRATVVADGAGQSLLPLLWMVESGAEEPGPRVARVARPAARRLCVGAIRRDEVSLTRAARGLAGLGPGLTPSGDDLLAGFIAAWTLVGEALGEGDCAARERLTAAIMAGAARGASPLGRAWLEHARRGELLEPMTRFVGVFLGPAPGDLGAAARGALSVGASSGTDWMVGFLLAGAALLEAPTSRRPW
jgi:Protein of unknown function (DUF2877)